MEVFEAKIREQFEKEIEIKKKIVNLLNEFGNCALRNNFTTLTISDNEKFIIADLIKMKIYNIRDILEEESPFSLECYCSMIFEIFFISEEGIIFENIDEKIKCFKTLIDTMNNIINLKKENLIITEYKNKNKYCKEIYDNIFIKQFDEAYLGFLSLIALYHGNNALKFLELFLRMLQNKLRIEIDFTLYDIRELPLEKALDDILKIFNKDEKVNYIHLIFKDNKIDYIPFSEEELKKVKKISVENYMVSDINIVNNGFKEQNDFIIIQNEQINIQGNEENKNEVESKVQEEKNSEINLEQKIIELQTKIEELTKRTNKQISVQNQKINNQGVQINQLNKVLYDYKKENSELKQKNNNLENKHNSFVLKSEKQIFNLKKNMEKQEKELIDNRYELKLIQSREAFRAFIDYFYYGLKFEDSPKYSIKIYNICEKLNSNDKVNSKIKEQIIKLLEKIYEKLIFGNVSAHSININKPIIEQIFDIIGNKKKYNKIIEKINGINMNEIIVELMSQRNEYFFDKNLLNKSEQDIYKKIPDLEKFIFN